MIGTNSVVENNNFYFYKILSTDCTRAYAHTVLKQQFPPDHSTTYTLQLTEGESIFIHLQTFHKLQKKGSLKSRYKE